MCYLSTAIERRAHHALLAALSAGLLAVLVILSPLAARAGLPMPRLQEVVIGGREHPPVVLEDIPGDERTIGLAIACGGDDRPVLLVEEDGQTIRVTASPAPREGPHGSFLYLPGSRIAPDNTVTGECRGRVELTSLPNPGDGDRQVGESLAVQAGDLVAELSRPEVSRPEVSRPEVSRPAEEFPADHFPRFVRAGERVPEVSRLQVISGETLVYDSRDDIRVAAEPVDGAYRLGLKVWFSTPVAPDRASVTAGLQQPYDGYEIAADPGFSEAPVWSTWRHGGDPQNEIRSLLETEFSIPEADAPNGGFLWFSISAISPTDAILDSNPEMPGDQRDTRHFTLLGLDAPYLSTLTWSNGNDLDLHVICPDGTRVYYGNMQACGINLDADMNAGGATTTSPVENVRWPNDPIPGLYGIYVDHYENHGGSDPTTYRVLVLVNGEELVFDRSISAGEDQHFITGFTIPEPPPPEITSPPVPGNENPDSDLAAE